MMDWTALPAPEPICRLQGLAKAYGQRQVLKIDALDIHKSEILTMSDEQGAYTLSDRATYLARTKTGLKLVVLVEGDKDLFNPFGIIAVNPARNPNIQAGLADQFIDWIISVPVQEKISQFGLADFGQSLFIPSSQPWLAVHPKP